MEPFSIQTNVPSVLRLGPEDALDEDDDRQEDDPQKGKKGHAADVEQLNQPYLLSGMLRLHLLIGRVSLFKLLVELALIGCDDTGQNILRLPIDHPFLKILVGNKLRHARKKPDSKGVVQLFG